MHVKIDTFTDRYAFQNIRTPFICSLAASLCFFMAFFLINWPFAGLPPELSGERVLLAVSRNAFRHWFMALSAGGAMALAIAPSFLRSLDFVKDNEKNVYRWCAAWAAFCALPATFTSWGLMLGIMARGQDFITANPGANVQILTILAGTSAFLCWLWCLWKKRSGMAAWLGLFFLLLKTLMPVFGQYWPGRI